MSSPLKSLWGKRADILRKIDALDREVAEFKSALKREKQMSRKIALNSEIRSRKDAILALEAQLKLPNNNQ